ncbi:hypothetical protein [Mesorhizobium sp.]|uniref:hypothetical protein n=1 Tax=Mesorhizobium sp. TaxID=1871066 RepID=UPI0025C70D2B|nr:hypothetical protein [Mesorhizobium sp.]
MVSSNENPSDDFMILKERFDLGISGLKWMTSGDAKYSGWLDREERDRPLAGIC